MPDPVVRSMQRAARPEHDECIGIRFLQVEKVDARSLQELDEQNVVEQDGRRVMPPPALVADQVRTQQAGETPGMRQLGRCWSQSLSDLA